MSETRYVLCRYCNELIDTDSKKCIFCNRTLFFDSLDILEILRSRIHETFERFYFESKITDSLNRTLTKIVKVNILSSIVSFFVFFVLNKDVFHIKSNAIPVEICQMPFLVFYISLYWFLLKEIGYCRDNFKYRHIDIDSSQCFLTYQRSDEFKEDFPYEEIRYFFGKIKNCRIKRYFINIIANNDKHLFDKKIKVIQEIEDFLSFEIEKVLDKYYFISYCQYLTMFCFMSSILYYFIIYLIISLPFILFFSKSDSFFIKISVLSNAELFINGLYVDTISISPLLGGFILGCLSMSIPLVFGFFHKKKHLESLYETRGQVLFIRDQVLSKKDKT